MKTCLKCSSLEFLLSQSGLLSLQGLDPLQNVGVLDVGFHPGGQGSSCCASTFCILKNKAKIRRTRCEKEHRSLPSAGVAVRRAAASPCQGHLWIEGSRVPVEQLLHALADLGCDAPGLEGSDVLTNATFGQKAAEQERIHVGESKRAEKRKEMKISAWKLDV